VAASAFSTTPPFIKISPLNSRCFTASDDPCHDRRPIITGLVETGFNIAFVGGSMRGLKLIVSQVLKEKIAEWFGHAHGYHVL
jgi:hypothetical protein